MTDDLRAFRCELAAPHPGAAARARARLDAAIAAERSADRPPRRVRPRAALAAAALAAALVSASAGLLGSGDRPASPSARPSPDAAHLPALGHEGLPDGLLVAAPAEGKDAGTRPRIDRGGWSECGIDGCYWL